eukprot:1389232-Pyramimonas_sp.AAC.1
MISGHASHSYHASQQRYAASRPVASWRAQPSRPRPTRPWNWGWITRRSCRTWRISAARHAASRSRKGRCLRAGGCRES